MLFAADGEIDADGAVNFSHMVTVAGQHSGSLPYNQRELQRYILLCAQQTDGGLRDKVYIPCILLVLCCDL
jgi:prenyltransferase beta subunit